MTKLKSGIASLSKNKLIQATVLDVIGDRCSVQLVSNGRKLFGIPFIGGPMSSGKTVYIDYSSGQPVAQARGEREETEAPVKQRPTEVVTEFSSENFISLADTPDNYIDQNNKVVFVNADATGLEFKDISSFMQTGPLFTFRIKPLSTEDCYLQSGVIVLDEDYVDEIIYRNSPQIAWWATTDVNDPAMVDAGQFAVLMNAFLPVGGPAAMLTTHWELYYIDGESNETLLGTTDSLTGAGSIYHSYTGYIAEPLMIDGGKLRIKFIAEIGGNWLSEPKWQLNFYGESPSVLYLPGSATALVVQEEGASLPARGLLNFVGDAVTVTDDEENAATVVTIESAASEFTQLSDAPASYDDQAGKLVAVNSEEDALEFIDAPNPDTAFLDLTDAPASYDGAGAKVVAVNSEEDALEFIDIPAPSMVFTDLTDVPASYIDQETKLVRVNATATGLEFVAAAAGGVDEFTDLSDVPSVYTDAAGKIVAVNIDEDGLEFIDAPTGEVAMADLTDVDLTDIADDDILQYDSVSGTWLPVTPPTGGGGALDDLTDVNAAAPSDGQVLTWDDSESEWIAADSTGGTNPVGNILYLFNNFI